MLKYTKFLEPPHYYGFTRNGAFYRPSAKEIFQEFFSRLNIFQSKKNWLPLFGWVTSLALAIPFFLFIFFYFSWWLLVLGFIYSMVVLGSHGTVWLHRYSTHRSFKFSHPFFRELCRNLVIKIVPEETYVISHHVHHRLVEQPGDPYNPHGGWLYCFLADVNHQPIARDLKRNEYKRLCNLMRHTGVKLNSYDSYQRWGSLCHPGWAMAHYALNWSFWYGAFFLLGGHALALALFGMSVFWAFGVRTFNYDGHGRGKNKQQSGVDFHHGDLSINQLWPGYVAGEWHNNHHLYPQSARAGFLGYQLDLPWLFIRSWAALGLISSYQDNKPDFLANEYRLTSETAKVAS